MFWRAKAIVIYSFSFICSFFVSFVVLTVLRAPSDDVPPVQLSIHERSAKNLPLEFDTQPTVALSPYYDNVEGQLHQPKMDAQSKVEGQFRNYSSTLSNSPLELNSTLKPSEGSKIDALSSFPVSMPFLKYLRNSKEVEKSGWVTQLRTFLKTVDKRAGSPHVNMVFGDSEHKLLVLNWVAASLVNLNPPLRNVLVLSLDHKLCSFLTSRDLPVTCMAVPAESLFSQQGGGGRQGRRKGRTWKIGTMVRPPVIRLISYWGYDVASYDSDAVPLINPQSLYQRRPDVHLFSAAGTFPLTTSKRWGFTLCTGTLLFRASIAIGKTISLALNGPC